LLTLLWNGLIRLNAQADDPVRAALLSVSGGGLFFDHVFIDRLNFYSTESPDLRYASFREAVLYYISFRNTNLENSSFNRAVLEGVDLTEARLENADFSEASLSEVVLVGADVRNASIRAISNISILVEDESTGQMTRLEDVAALGYLAWKGAQTDPIPAYHIYRYHSRFPIVDKILRKLGEQGNRQRHGITKKGVSKQDPVFAEKLVSLLEANGYAHSGRRDLIAATDDGRNMIGRYIANNDIPSPIVDLLQESM
jgi:hypothetical protein